MKSNSQPAIPLIIIVGNDHMMNRSWVRVFERGLGSRYNFETVCTEQAFRERFTDLDHLPAAVFMGAKFRWCYPSENMTPEPRDVIEGGRPLSGYRCVEFIRSTSFTAMIPVLLENSPAWRESKPKPAEPIAYWTLGESDSAVVRRLQQLLQAQKEVVNSR